MMKINDEENGENTQIQNMENSRTQNDSLENIADINEVTNLTPADDDILD